MCLEGGMGGGVDGTRQLGHPGTTSSGITLEVQIAHGIEETRLCPVEGCQTTQPVEILLRDGLKGGIYQ